MTLDDILTGGDAAKVLGLSREGVRYTERQGALIPFAVTVGGVHLFRRRDVESLKAARARRRRHLQRTQSG